MDGITQALQSLNSSGALKDATAVAGLGSSAYNMYNQYQNQQYQDKLRSFAQDPTKMNAYAAQFTQPLTAGLQTGVANQAQADLASRGLTDSPEISQQVYAQALAPYTQQNQQNGYSNALQALNLGGGAVSPNNSSANTISSLAKMLSLAPNTGTGALPTLQDYLRTMGTLPAQINQNQPGAAPGPIDTSGLDAGGMPDMSGMFPSSQSNVSTPDSGYVPDYAALSTTGGDGYQ